MEKTGEGALKDAGGEGGGKGGEGAERLHPVGGGRAGTRKSGLRGGGGGGGGGGEVDFAAEAAPFAALMMVPRDVPQAAGKILKKKGGTNVEAKET